VLIVILLEIAAPNDPRRSIRNLSPMLTLLTLLFAW
jgi:hypothetical protein